MRVEKDMVINAPVARVYDLWTDFENFPRFMSHVEEVRRTGEDTLHWKAKIGPVTKEWEAEIKALVSNRTVTWRSIDGAHNAGAVTLAEKGHITEMHVVIEYHASIFEAVAETITHELSRSIESDLDRFKALAEERDSGRVAQAVAASSGFRYQEADERAGYTGSGPHDERDHQGRVVRDTTPDETAGNTTAESRATDTSSRLTSGSGSGLGSSSMSSGSSTEGSASGSMGNDRGNDDRDSAANTGTGGAYTANAADMVDVGTPGQPGGNDTTSGGAARIVSRVEIEGLGSDESPGEAVGSTSPEEVAAARAALGGGSAGADSSGRDDTSFDPIGAGGGTAGSGVQGPTGGGTMGGSAGTMGGTLPNDPTGGTGSVTTGEGSLGPSLMTYEAGGPPEGGAVPGPSGTSGGSGSSSMGSSGSGGGSGGTGGGRGSAGGGADTDLGSLTDSRLNVGSTTVSSGSYTAQGRADETGGMTDRASGPTTVSDTWDAQSGPADTGGQANIPSLGNTPHGGGTGRGRGDAYGSGVSDAASGMGNPGLGSAHLGIDAVGDEVTGGGDVADRDVAEPASDLGSGGTGVGYEGGTGGWGTEAPGSAAVAGWQPSSATGTSGEGNLTGSGGSETH